MHRRRWPRARAKCPARQSRSRAAQRAACGSPTRAGTPFRTSLKLSGAERHATPGSGLGCPLHVARGRVCHLRRATHQTAAVTRTSDGDLRSRVWTDTRERIGWLQHCFSPEFNSDPSFAPRSSLAARETARPARTRAPVDAGLPVRRSLRPLHCVPLFRQTA